MDRRCIVICDSGAGGLCLLNRLSSKIKGEKFLYYADYGNLPYGEKSPCQLLKIAEENIKKLLPFCPKKIIFACNTLSVSTMGLKTSGGVEIVRVLPKVKDKGKGLILCTEATAKSRWVQDLKIKNPLLEVQPMRGLAEMVESRLSCGTQIDFEGLFNGLDRNYDFVSLACTHYSVVKSDIQKVFPFSQILSGEDDVFEKFEFSVTTFDTSLIDSEISFVGRWSEKAKSLYYKGFLNL